MFVQVIQGQVDDAGALRAALDRWVAELAPNAIGWLGSTGGVTADGRGIALARFASAEDARRNSERPEQGAWWAETSKAFRGDVTFHDSTDVLTAFDGGSDDAGFVQVIQGRTSDVERMRALNSQASDTLREYRPDIIGWVVALHGDGGFTQAAYFRSEAAAREGERREPPPELKAQFEEEMALMSDATFFDLTDPWLHSPR
jgi:hypothetical protein